MKQFKRITGVALAFVFALTTAVTALAATPEQEQEVLSHAFNVYQVMAANGVNGELLTSVSWGDGFDGSGFLADIKDSSDFVCLLHKGSRRSRSDRKLRGRQRDRQGIR